MSKKTYVLDTSVYLTDFSSLKAFDNNDIIIPLKVLEEIDKHKKRQDGVGSNARQIIRLFDELREKVVCVEDEQFTHDYHDPDKRSIANALLVEFNDGNSLEEIVCEYPIGHKRRRSDGLPLLEKKFQVNLARRFDKEKQDLILAISLDQKRLEAMPVNEYVDLYIP